ncbi:MAG: cupin domain-containing protein [Planctomycetes bacterium]|nr:cupin domain-containing protein [Planctomycetota bacterium]
MPRIERPQVRAEWATHGFTCELWVDPPDQVWHDFQHDVDERVLLLEGEIQVEMPGRTVRLLPGDELEIPAGTRHTVRNCSRGLARWLHGYRTGAGEAEAAG